MEDFLDILAWVFLFPCLLFTFIGFWRHVQYLQNPFAYHLYAHLRGTVTVFYWPRWALASVVAICWLVARQL